MSLADGVRISGKLVWKVDWPMRWRSRTFLRAGGRGPPRADGQLHRRAHAGRELFGAEAPLSAVYSFVEPRRGRRQDVGLGRRCGDSRGGDTVVEPAIVRWPYVQRTPNQSFAIDVSAGRAEALRPLGSVRGARGGAGREARDQAANYRHSVRPRPDTSTARRGRVSFRLLALAADITKGNREQMARIVASHLDGPLPETEQLLAELEPRLSCALHYATEIVPPEQRTTIRETSTTRRGRRSTSPPGGRGDAGARHPRALVARRADHARLRRAEAAARASADTAPTPELKQAQRQFFKALYQLLCSAETGPRLPTLMLSIGQDATLDLLGAGVRA